MATLKLFFVFTIMLTVGHWNAPQGMRQVDQLQDNGDDQHLFLPIIFKSNLGIYGYVTFNSQPIEGIPLSLKRYEGAMEFMVGTTTTNTQGLYSFKNVPDLESGKYRVQFENTISPEYLSVWYTRELGSYTSGTEVRIGNFDIMNVELDVPEAGANISLPYTFRWNPRPGQVSDSYEFNLFDIENDWPWFWTDPALGYIGEYRLQQLPPDFVPGRVYGWGIGILGPDGSYGQSYWYYEVAFNS